MLLVQVRVDQFWGSLSGDTCMRLSRVSLLFLCFTCISTTLMIFSYHGLCRDELRMQTHGLTIESYIVDVSSSRVRRPICASDQYISSQLQSACFTKSLLGQSIIWQKVTVKTPILGNGHFGGRRGPGCYHSKERRSVHYDHCATAYIAVECLRRSNQQVVAQFGKEAVEWPM